MGKCSPTPGYVPSSPITSPISPLFMPLFNSLSSIPSSTSSSLSLVPASSISRSSTSVSDNSSPDEEMAADVEMPDDAMVSKPANASASVLDGLVPLLAAFVRGLYRPTNVLCWGISGQNGGFVSYYFAGRPVTFSFSYSHDGAAACIVAVLTVRAFDPSGNEAYRQVSADLLRSLARPRQVSNRAYL
jgi:hypothetical protein